MNLRTNQKGFTIVELLIVVVVIAILAAISIVAYTGITNRANTSSAKEAANSVKSVATVYQGSNGTWPSSKANFTSGGGEGIAKLPSDITFITVATYGSAGANAISAVQALTDPKSVAVFPCLSTGMIVYYKNYSTGLAESMIAGDCGTLPLTGVASITNT
jgi:prepilin-type N-terminal cleavage/methylation domain-containing protein